MGRNASIKLDSGINTVQDLYDWKIELSSTPIEQPVFGDTWGKTHGLGVNKWSGSFDGIFSADDTTGQVALRAAQIAGTMVSGVRFYLDTTTYYSGDLYITNHGPATSPEEVAKLTYTFNGTGELSFTTA
jgi:hypothetical protein